MLEKRMLLRNGYWVTVQVISKDINHIYIRDSNLYPDSDSRSVEKREWLIPINDIEKLKELGESILKLCK